MADREEAGVAELRGMVTRGTLATYPTDDGMRTAQVEIDADDTADDVEVFEPFGFTSRPLAGAESINLAVGGDQAHMVTICVADCRYRLTGLAAGEVAIYNSQGAKVVLNLDGSIDVTPALAGKVKIGGPAAIKTIALNEEVVAAFGQICAVWSALVPSTWAVDAPILKGAYASIAGALATTLPGSPKGQA